MFTPLIKLLGFSSFQKEGFDATVLALGGDLHSLYVKQTYGGLQETLTFPVCVYEKEDAKGHIVKCISYCRSRFYKCESAVAHSPCLRYDLYPPGPRTMPGT